MTDRWSKEAQATPDLPSPGARIRAALDAVGKRMRTAPVTWEEMVADPVSGQARILSNQIADRDEEIEWLRAALTEITNLHCLHASEEVIARNADRIARAALAGKER